MRRSTLQYRLSPHVTFSARDGFQKTLQCFQPAGSGIGAGAVFGGTQEPNFSVIPPIADLLSNSGNVGHQLSIRRKRHGRSQRNVYRICTIRIRARFPACLIPVHRAGRSFYSFRVSKMNYIGVTYQYQRLVSYPTLGPERDTDSCGAFLLHAVCHVEVFIFVFRRPAILGYSAATNCSLMHPTALRREAGPRRRRQFELARPPQQLRHQLLPHYFERRQD